MVPKNKIVTTDKIVDLVRDIRDFKVMLDDDLAEMYGEETKRLNERVKRNKVRFPKDFMFQLTKDEFKNLKSQSATSSWGGRRTPPYAFTEMGVFMLANILNTEMAIRTSIQIIRGFVKFRKLLSSPISRADLKNFSGLIETLRELEQSKKQKGAIKQTFYITTGKQSPIIVGHNAMVQIANKVNKGDLISLKQGLESIDVPFGDIKDLLEILKTESQIDNNGEYRKKTKAWIKRMMGKAIDGSWRIGIEVAGALIAELLNGFLGL